MTRLEERMGAQLAGKAPAPSGQGDRVDSTTEPLFDIGLFCTLLRHMREKAGMNGDAMVASIEETTGYKMPRDTLYRIEKGKQQPTLEQVIAINLTLNGLLVEGLPLRVCMCERWRDMDRRKEARNG